MVINHLEGTVRAHQGKLQNSKLGRLSFYFGGNARVKHYIFIRLIFSLRLA